MVNLFPGVLTIDPANPDVEFAPTSTSNTPWSDTSDDLSQAILYMTWDGATATRHGRVDGSLPALVGTPTSLVAHMRARTQMLSGTPEDMQMTVALYGPGETPFLQIGDGTGTLPNHFWSVAVTPGFADYSVTITESLCAAWSTSLAAITSLLQSGNAKIRAQPNVLTPHAAIDYQCLVAALWIEATGITGGGPPPGEAIARRGIPLRQFPRDDGRQTASARRNFPPPKSYQSSTRRGGGYL